MEELLLWRWSTTVQVLSALTITVFFLVIGRSTGRRELGWWVAAWSANLLALGVTITFWFTQPGPLITELLRAPYFFGKTLFCAFMVAGTLAFARGQALPVPPLAVWPPVLVFALVAAWLCETIPAVGMVQCSVIALLLGTAAVICARSPGHGLGWLGIGLAVRALLGVVEAIAYWNGAGYPPPAFSALVNLFIASHSSFDTGAEWLIALGCVLAVAHRTQSELRQRNAELTEAHRVVREIAERDALTGLANRRMLPLLLQQASEHGASVLFFDLDDFKRVNDSDGHHVGDACLKRFAGALQGAFPDAQALVRFAGDEFVAVVPGAGADALRARVETLRTQLAQAEGETPGIRFSAGHAALLPSGDPQAVLRDADAAMYAQKAARRALPA